jgi:PKHD-type hydroxylase
MFDRNYVWPIRNGTDSPWAYQENYFSADDCAKIIELGQAIPAVAANLGNQRQINQSVRSTTVGFFNPQDIHSQWIFQRLQSAITVINRDFWNFELNFIECLQFSKYQLGDFYTAHMDLQHDRLEQRKLSVSVQLSDPTGYQGGDLRMFRHSDQWDMVPRSQGTLVVFPSYQVHEVTAVEFGQRYSLVAWVAGPPYR